jgi:hypothetical protein
MRKTHVNAVMLALVFALFTGACGDPRMRDDSTVSRADANVA